MEDDLCRGTAGTAAGPFADVVLKNVRSLLESLIELIPDGPPYGL